MLRAGLLLLFAPVLSLAAEEPRMSWLDDGEIRLGVDLELGGAITWLSRSGTTENVINSKDWGREVQMSFYGGPIPFWAGEKRPAPTWAGLGWNPIQAGDYAGHRARVLETTNEGGKLYVKSIPMQWPLAEVPGECTFESWLELEGPCVRARGRLVNARADHTAYGARDQELPAVYTNGSYHRILTYTGERPFTGEPPVELAAKPPTGWGHWAATEGWSALLDDHGFGLGVWSPGCLEWLGGFNGRPGFGGSADNACGYLAPTRREVLDHDITYDFRYYLVLGTLEEIRSRAAQWRTDPPAWRFKHDRQGWTRAHAEDAGCPSGGEWKVSWHVEDPQLLSPLFFARAETASAVTLEAAFRTGEDHAELYWSTLSEPGFDAQRRVRFPVVADGQFHTVRVPLPAAAGQALRQLRLDPADGGEGEVRLRSLTLEAK